MSGADEPGSQPIGIAVQRNGSEAREIDPRRKSVQEVPVDRLAPIEVATRARTVRIARVIGERRFAYDLWGPAVNLVIRLESHGVAGGIQVSAATRALLGAGYDLESRGTIDLKGIGPTEAWLLSGRS